MQHLKSQVDLTALTCISKSDLQQMVETAQPYPVQGFVIFSHTAPDVVTNPELANFIWGYLDGGGVKTGDFYYYNGTSWELIPLVDGSKLADGSVPLSKLSLTGSTPYYIIQVNGTGTALQWVSIINAISNNTLPVAKLVSPDNVNDYILTSSAGVKAFMSIANFFLNLVPENTILIDSLTRALAGSFRSFLTTRADGSAVEWQSGIQVGNLNPTGGTALQQLRVKADESGIEYFSPASSSNFTFIAPVNLFPTASAAVPAWTTIAIPATIPRSATSMIVQTKIFTDGSPGSGEQVQIDFRPNALSSVVVTGLGQCGSDTTNTQYSQIFTPFDPTGFIDYRITVLQAGDGFTILPQVIGYTN